MIVAENSLGARPSKKGFTPWNPNDPQEAEFIAAYYCQIGEPNPYIKTCTSRSGSADSGKVQEGKAQSVS